MNETGEMWKELKDERKEKRAANRSNSLSLLLEVGLHVEIHNDGAHLIVRAHHNTYDFWPGTGLFRKRGEGCSHRGVKKLLSIIAEDGQRVGYGVELTCSGVVASPAKST